MPRAALRRALALFLPVAALATLTCGLVYLVAQQELRQGANEPQVRIAGDAARALDAGARPGSVVGQAKVDVALSLAPFVIVHDAGGRVLATDGVLDGGDPVLPPGVLSTARASGEDRVTWQPREGVRVATVTVPWSGGTVTAGRSLREVERQEDRLLLLVGAACLVTVGALAVVAALAGWLWPAP